MCVCVHINIHTYTQTYTHIYACVCVCVCAYVCMYVHIYYQNYLHFLYESALKLIIITCRIVDFAVPADQWVKLKENEKIND